jgi:hypothetical protein
VKVGNISNIEVMEVLRVKKERTAESRKGLARDLHNSKSVEEQVSNFIKKSPIGGKDVEVARDILRKLQEGPYKQVNFTTSDRLQILNTLPKELVELYLVSSTSKEDPSHSYPPQILEPATMAELELHDLVNSLLEELSAFSTTGEVEEPAVAST